jgi:hypothetical protein
MMKINWILFLQFLSVFTADFIWLYEIDKFTIID